MNEIIEKAERKKNRRAKNMKTKYYAKYPREKFTKVTDGYYHSVEKAIKMIENHYRAGTTSEPYIQLISWTEDGWTVLAEWEPARNGWLTPLQAMGLSGRCI